MNEAPFVARFSKWRAFLKVVIFLAMMAISLWSAGIFGPRESVVWAGWIGALFSSLGIIGFGRMLFDDDDQLVVSNQGVRIKRWSAVTIPWNEFSKVGTWSFRSQVWNPGQKMIVFTLAHPDRFPSSTRSGRVAKINLARTGGEILVSMIGTNRSFDEAMVAIERFRG